MSNAMFKLSSVAKIIRGKGAVDAFQVFLDAYEELKCCLIAYFQHRPESYIDTVLAYIINNPTAVFAWLKATPLHLLYNPILIFFRHEFNAHIYFDSKGRKNFFIYGLTAIFSEGQIFTFKPTYYPTMESIWMAQHDNSTLDASRVFDTHEEDMKRFPTKPYFEKAKEKLTEDRDLSLDDDTLKSLHAYVCVRGYKGTVSQLKESLLEQIPIPMKVSHDDTHDWHRTSYAAAYLMLHPTARVLDVGGGDGGQALSIHRYFPKATITIVDPGVGMAPPVSECGESYKASPIHGNIRHVGPAYAEWLGTKYDLVLLNMVVHHVEGSLLEFFFRLKEVLEPGGLIVIRDHNVDSRDVDKFCHWIHKFWELSGGPPCGFTSFTSANDLRTIIRGSGLAQFSPGGVYYENFTAVGGRGNAYIYMLAHPSFLEAFSERAALHVVLLLMSHPENTITIDQAVKYLHLKREIIVDSLKDHFPTISLGDDGIFLSKHYADRFSKRKKKYTIDRDPLPLFEDHLKLRFGRVGRFTTDEVLASRPGANKKEIIDALRRVQESGNIEERDRQQWYWLPRSVVRYGIASRVLIPYTF